VPNTYAGRLGLFGLVLVWSTMTWPPSPPAWSNHRVLASDLRIVPLSCVPPQYWPGTCGTVAMLVNWVIRRPVEWISAPVFGSTEPFRFSQSAAESGSAAPLRPPPVNDCQTPPSLPIATCWVLSGSKAIAW
jgi:hypothetical protein